MPTRDASIQAVIFDYGGVLTTSGRAALSAWTRAENIRPDTFSAALKQWLSRTAAPGTPIHLLETGELPVEDFNRALAERLRTNDDRAVAPEGLLARMFAHMNSDPDMHTLVRNLRDRGVRTAMLSNSWGNEYPWDELDGLFEFTVISAEVRLRKPDPRIYHLVLDRLGLSPREAVFVDDAAPNIEAADEIGLHTVHHADAASTRAKLADLIPEYRTVGEEH